MRRENLEHIIRAAGTIVETDVLVILGSQAILGSFPNAPEELLVSQEVDTYPLDDPDKADLIDGTIGEMSPFHETFGYYAHGVGPDTAVLPRDWQTRAIQLKNENTRGITGLCLHPSDLAISKLIAGRPKDFVFVSALLRYNLVRLQEIKDRLIGLTHEQADSVLVKLNSIIG